MNFHNLSDINLLHMPLHLILSVALAIAIGVPNTMFSTKF